MPCDSSGQDLVNSFALVTYIPDPLGKFLDDLRRELIPACVPHAHVTILPPRPLCAAREDAIEAIRLLIPDFSPFEIRAGETLIFPVSDVVQMYRALNTGHLRFQELFPYHPHITLAQNLTHDQAVELAAIARRRWSEYKFQRGFQVESLSFVQSTVRNLWVDLEHFQLEPASVRG